MTAYWGQLTFSGAVMDLSAPPTSHEIAHTATHSREGDIQKVGHVTGRHQVDHTGRTSTGTASGRPVMQYRTCAIVVPESCVKPVVP